MEHEEEGRFAGASNLHLRFRLVHHQPFIGYAVLQFCQVPAQSIDGTVQATNLHRSEISVIMDANGTLSRTSIRWSLSRSFPFLRHASWFDGSFDRLRCIVIMESSQCA
jgi:hypothetical protein